MPVLAQPITAADVREHLVGMEGWLKAAAAVGFDDGVIATSVIPAGVRQFEDETDFRINPIQVVNSPDGTYDDINNPGYDKTGLYETYVEEGYPYLPEYALEYMDVWLKHKPVRQLQRARFILAQNAQIMNIPDAWFQMERRTGRFTIMPLAGAAAVSGITAFTVIDIGFGNKSYVPHLLAFDYIAGLPDNWASTKEWAHLKRAVCQWCAASVCADIQEQYAAGLLSVSVGMGAGGSQSIAPSRFEAKRQYLEASAQRVMQRLKEKEDGLLFGIA